LVHFSEGDEQLVIAEPERREDPYFQESFKQAERFAQEVIDAWRKQDADNHGKKGDSLNCVIFVARDSRRRGGFAEFAEKGRG
jgi:hypothetical protein